ncbi:tetratricopeptide repeat protein [bacterium]|nr:tetratricopeptide repeat protein [bacterium]
MSDQNISNQIGQAWNYHRQGKHQDAVAAFAHVLKSAPNNVDAHYGHGLALRALGDRVNAAESFRKAQELAQEHLTQLRAGGGGGTATAITSNVLDSSEDDRYMMLTRMAGQRLAEVTGS